MKKRLSKNLKLRAYIIGLSLGDGNLSNSNGRAVKLRITCDKKYPRLVEKIANSLQKLLPDNKVGRVDRGNSVDVYCYSNYLESILGWTAKGGSKIKQGIFVPSWIIEDASFSKECLRGLFQTDGSIYYDRGYLMVNFVNHAPILVSDIVFMIKKLGFYPNLQKLKTKNGLIKHTIRISKNTLEFIGTIKLIKD